MVDKIKKRPWWLRKTEVGCIIMTLGVIMHFIPITAPVATTVICIGGLIADVGTIHRNIKGDAK